VIEKEKKTKLNNYTIQHNETKSIEMECIGLIVFNLRLRDFFVYFGCVR